MATATGDKLDALRTELRDITVEPELLDFIIARVVETLGGADYAVASLGGSPRVASAWGMVAMFYVKAGMGDDAKRLAMHAAREARMYLAKMDQRLADKQQGPCALSDRQLAAHAGEALTLARWTGLNPHGLGAQVQGT